MPYVQKQESRVPYAPRFFPLPCSSCPPSQMMLRLGATAARRCLFESPEPREPLSTSGTPQRGQAAAPTQPRASTAPSSPQSWSQPSFFPSRHRQTGPGGRCRAGAAPLLGSGAGSRARRHRARAIVCWPGTKAWPGGVAGWLPSAAAASRRQQQWDFAVPASGCKGSGGLGRGPASSSRSSAGTRVSASPSKCRHLSNVISETILLNLGSVTQGCGAQPPPGSSQAQPSATAPALALAPAPASAPVSAPGPARPGHAAASGRDPGARGSGRPSGHVLGLPPVDWSRGRDRGDRGDARLRAEPKAVLVFCECAGIKPPRQRAPFILACGAAAAASAGLSITAPRHRVTCQHVRQARHGRDREI